MQNSVQDDEKSLMDDLIKQLKLEARRLASSLPDHPELLSPEIKSLAYAYCRRLESQSEAELPSLVNAETYVDLLLDEPIKPQPTYPDLAKAVIACDTLNAMNHWKDPLLRALVCEKCKLYFTSVDGARCTQCRE